MNIYDVKLTHQAEAQLRDVAWYIAVELQNPDAAQHLVDDLEKAFTKLSKNPERHSLVDEEPWRGEGIRKTRVKHFLVYFWIDTENAAVQVTGIVYEGRDQKRALGQMKKD